MPPAPPPRLQAQRAAGLPASLWLRISGLCVGAASLAGARLEVGPELAALLGGGGGGGHGSVSLAQRLAESPSLAAFCVELQNMVDQLSLERWVWGCAAQLLPCFHLAVPVCTCHLGAGSWVAACCVLSCMSWWTS